MGREEWGQIDFFCSNRLLRAGSFGSISSELFKDRSVALGMAGCGLFFMGQFALFTYVQPFLETVTRIDVSTLSFVLLVIRVAGFVGPLIISTFLKRSLYGTLSAIPILMALIAIALIPFGTWPAAVAALLGLWGLMATAALVGWWSWIAQALPRDAEAGGGLMVAVIQLAIAPGSTVGGLLFDSSGYRSTFVASATLLLAALLTFITSHWQAAQRA
jgi:predicted MFS family arabinose efflux permease